jgi:hypothetical protein
VLVASPFHIPSLGGSAPVQHFDPSDPAQVARLGDDSQFLAAVEQEMASVNPPASTQARQAVRDALAHCNLAALTNEERAQIVQDVEHPAAGTPGKEYGHVVEDIYVLSNLQVQSSVPAAANPPQVLPQHFTLPPVSPKLPAPPTQPGAPAIVQTALPPVNPSGNLPALMMANPGVLRLIASPASTSPTSLAQLANDDYFLAAVYNAMDSNHSRQYSAHVMLALYNCDLSHLSIAERATILSSVTTLARGAPTITQQDNQYEATLQLIASSSNN